MKRINAVNIHALNVIPTLCRICLVTLASKHPVLAEGLVKKVDYNIDGRNLQTSNNVSGKKKKGAIKTKPRMPICKVTGASGNDYLIRR